ncbi:MAG: aminotransferase class V-fold PLP-dependent enzyme, partial [Alphaproteobacteria bacterium]|nr:aminotransferase class V-fold PLP-dependent enzyme [Alphaproteobacteria bacterium]
KALIYGRSAPRLPNTSNIAMPGIDSETQVMAFDLEGYCISAGSACSSGKVNASHVLMAMGASESAARQAIRVSLGWATKQEDVSGFIETWKRLYHRLNKRKAAG